MIYLKVNGCTAGKSYDGHRVAPPWHVLHEHRLVGSVNIGLTVMDYIRIKSYEYALHFRRLGLA